MREIWFRSGGVIAIALGTLLLWPVVRAISIVALCVWRSPLTKPVSRRDRLFVYGIVGLVTAYGMYIVFTIGSRISQTGVALLAFSVSFAAFLLAMLGLGFYAYWLMAPHYIFDEEWKGNANHIVRAVVSYVRTSNNVAVDIEGSADSKYVELV